MISADTDKEHMQVLVEHRCRSSNAHKMFLSVEWSEFWSEFHWEMTNYPSLPARK